MSVSNLQLQGNKNLIVLLKHFIYISITIALCFVKIPIGIYGGSINLMMIPIILYALDFGLLYGLCFGAITGLCKFIIANGFAIDVYSLLLDYMLAYMVLGLAGIAKNKKMNIVVLAIIGCILLRYIIHVISGVTIYAKYAQNSYLNISTPTIFIYSLVYNAHYLLASSIITMIVILCFYIVYNYIDKKKTK